MRSQTRSAVKMSAPTPRETVEFARTTLGFAGDDVTFLPPGPWLMSIKVPCLSSPLLR